MSAQTLILDPSSEEVLLLLNKLAAMNETEDDRRESTRTMISDIRDICLRQEGRMDFLFGENGQPGWVQQTTRRIETLERDRTFLAGAWAVLVMIAGFLGIDRLLSVLHR